MNFIIILACLINIQLVKHTIYTNTPHLIDYRYSSNQLFALFLGKSPPHAARGTKLTSGVFFSTHKNGYVFTYICVIITRKHVNIQPIA